MKRGLKKLAVILAAVSLTGCQNDTRPAPDITSGIEDGTKSDISEAIGTADISIGEATDSGEEVFIPKLLMDTDKPFVLAEDYYIIEKRDIDVSAFNEYGIPDFAADGKYYYSSSMSIVYGDRSSISKQAPDKEATIFAYDSESGECRTLYSEAPKVDGNQIDIIIREIRNSYLYFVRRETGLAENQTSADQTFKIISNDVLRLNLRDNSTEKVFSFGDKDVTWTYVPVISGDMLFITVSYYINNKWTHAIYQYDTNTGEASLFREDAQFPFSYNNGIIYFHDGGYYYHGEASDIKGQGISYQGDELIFSESKEIHEEYIANMETDVLIYTHINTNEGDFHVAGSTMGIFDQSFNRIEIASTKKDTWTIRVLDISKTGLAAIDAPKPMIYDVNEECFAVISIDDYSRYYSYAIEDSICFFGYDEGDDGKYISAALYTVKRR